MELQVYKGMLRTAIHFCIHGAVNLVNNNNYHRHRLHSLPMQPYELPHTELSRKLRNYNSESSVQVSKATDTLAETKGLNMSHDGDSIKRRSPRRLSAHSVT
jgi:hypothetical protein